MTCRRARLSRLQSQIVQSYGRCRCGPSRQAKQKSLTPREQAKLTWDKPRPGERNLLRKSTMMSAVTTHSRILVLNGDKGQGQLPVQFVFDDTSFTFKDSSTSTWASYSDYFVSLPHVHPAGSSHVHVPLTHVLSVDMTGSAVDARILVRIRHSLKLVNVSGSFQGDNSEASSSAKDWVQDVMTAAYSGLLGLRALLPQLNHSLRCQGTAAPLGIYKSTWRSRA
jgi:hypothetical protein